MGWILSDGWRMAGLVAFTGSGLLVLNVRELLQDGIEVLALVSTGAALFVALLGLALLIETEETGE